MPKKKLKGQIVSDKMTKTVVVSVEMFKRHPLYNKSVRNTRRFKARNEMEVKVGDIVMIEESAPFSKEVTWKVIEKLER